MLILLAIPAAGCATVVHDQVAVPGTKQRILVGHDGWPFPKMWVLEDGTLHRVQIVREDK